MGLRHNFLQSPVKILPMGRLTVVFAIYDLFNSVPADVKIILNELLKI